MALRDTRLEFRPDLALHTVQQASELWKVTQAFGRHLPRIATLGRTCTPEEVAYIAEGQFPHLRPF